ncbi:hypothetical protein IFT90_15965 [Frigoribacterium sp. CFBP 8766]|uniref:hypothetical protein n=1 Tax=Frigoribacterium sp. CFBP 8766 TaxID=2775273 RepID=UPI00177FC338|nr:hypothetical protein [Frigoribacterium sp. CFBP 8766]MBD8586053.1 hypothetical protein [Frigoribacterium sp. CFBP 8766]
MTVILTCWAISIVLAFIAVAFAVVDTRGGRKISRRAYVTLGACVLVALAGTAYAVI